MDWKWFVFNFVVLMIFFVGLTVFVIKRTLFSSTDSALKKLDAELSKANAKQAELTRKLKEADEELQKRQKEAAELADRMRNDAEEESKNEREKIISKAREEGEEIISKAQNSKEKLKMDLEKEIDTKVIKISIRILNEILSNNAKESFNDLLIEEFLEKLQNVDMSRISPEIKDADLISVLEVSKDVKEKFGKLIEVKLGRKINVNTSVDSNLGGGMVLKFGSMALDGSLQNLIRETGVRMQEEVDVR